MTGTPRLRLAPLLCGTFLLLVYIQLSKVQPYQSTAGIDFNHISADELRFWLAHWLLALPALVLMALGFVDYLGPRLERLFSTLDDVRPRRWALLGLTYVVLLTLLAAAGRSYFLLDLPLTDDENMVAFGARMLLNGDLSVPILEPDGAFTQVVTYRHAGRVSSFDYPGALLFHALSIASGLGSLLYALAGAVTGLAVAATAGRFLGRSGALIAACFWLCSPMSFTLAMTEHAQVASRLFLALTFWIYSRLVTGASSPARGGMLIGLAGGLAFLTRSPEAACVLLPIAAHLAWRLRAGDRATRRAALAAAPVMLAVLLFYAWYNHNVTGIWYLPPRYGPERHQAAIPFGSPLWQLGSNLGHNLFILIVMALGPLGMLAAGLGVERKAPWLVLALGVAFQVGLALLYDDTGIHTVGPIHFSETLLGLSLLATAGVIGVLHRLRRLGVSSAISSTILLVYSVIALGSFTYVHSLGLRRQARNAAMIHDVIVESGITNALVIADRPTRLILGHYESRETGTWVHWLPPPDPYLEDPVIFVARGTDLKALHDQFRNRDLYSLLYNFDDPPVRLVQLGWDGSKLAQDLDP